MGKKLVLMLLLVAVGLICWTVMDVQAQQRGGGGAGGGGQQRGAGGAQATADEMVKFLTANGFTADADALKAVAKDATKQTELLATLNRKYGGAMRMETATPGSAKDLIARLKVENDVEAAVKAAKAATDKAPATKKVAEQVGKLFDMILAQQTTAPKANQDAWKKNEDNIVKVRVDELMLDVPASFPWAAQAGGRRGG